MGLSRRLLNWARAKSPWMTVFNSGSCNACDIELLATLTPRYDMERFGMLMQGSPRHADILIVTGPVTRKQAPRLRRIWEQMPDPKYVIAMGPCGANGGPFRGLYHVVGGVDQVIPVDLYIAGCPPRPDEILDGIAACMKLMKDGAAPNADLPGRRLPDLERSRETPAAQSTWGNLSESWVGAAPHAGPKPESGGAQSRALAPISEWTWARIHSPSDCRVRTTSSQLESLTGPRRYP